MPDRCRGVLELVSCDDDRALPLLLAALADRSRKVRALVAEALAQRDRFDFVPCYVRDLGHDRWGYAAGELLGRLGGAHAVAPLAEALEGGDSRVGQDAMWALEQIGPAALPALEIAVRHPEKQVRYKAIYALADIRDPRSADALAPLLEDTGWGGLSTAAAMSLGLMGDARSAERLIEVARDGVQASAATNVLRSLLQGAATEICDAALRDLCTLACIGQTVYDDAPYPSSTAIGSDPIDCDEINRLARAELARREGEAF